MDSNKDEAERCMEYAEKYLSEKKFDEAEKFLKKAQKLYPTKRVEGKLLKIFSLYIYICVYIKYTVCNEKSGGGRKKLTTVEIVEIIVNFIFYFQREY